ncbi:MAG TPA: RHS repeat-associated core domain-containing protein [Thermoanaerobaculia bacterium]|nr:RHS repeat-associated core domain-containing protein [Thermoanaerobaculia bacterium]
MARRDVQKLAVVLLSCLTAPAAEAQSSCGDTSIGNYFWTASGQITKLNNCQGPTGSRCYPVENKSWYVEKTNPACDPVVGSCGVRIHATATIPGVRDMVVEDGLGSALTPWVEWYPCQGAACTRDIFCGVPPGQAQINFDNLDTWLERGVSCAQAKTLTLSVKILVCPNVANCASSTVIDIPAVELAQSLGCPSAPPSVCGEPSGGASGAAELSCPLCQPVGGGAGAGCGVPAGGGGPSCEPASLGKAQVRYAAGGVGGDGLPGSAAWRTALGRFWVHDFAERIVVDPDSSHVWLLTRYGSFREFSNPASGSGLRLYQNRAPSDEFRQLYFDTATGGWELHTLDGRTDVFRSDGLWLRTVFAADPTHPIQGTYNASNQLASVSFPDGRSDTFTYHPDGKLAAITEVAVAGSGTPSRTWTFTWTGDELTLATRPDGTAWQFFYDSSRPGYLTRMDLVSGPQGRVAAAFEYAAGSNNVAKSWRGDPSFTGPEAVDKVTYSYTNPALPTQAVVTRTVSATFNQVTTYALARDTVSAKPKLSSMQGSCPACGLSPTTSFAYTGTNPLLPSSMTDAKNTRTDYTYDANGRLKTKTDAANVPALTRLTTYSYDPSFPGLVTRVEVPSTSAGTNKRRTDSAYDSTTGVLTTRTIDSYEAGAPLPSGFKVTTYGHNGSGEVSQIDPPGFGTADATSFTYNLAGRNGHVADSRTDPLVGATTFGYDGLNRRTSVIDPNSVETVTSYDALNRVTEVRRKGATPADDLVTTYTYTPFGDLFCTKLPRGNGIEYVYDAAGRLVELIRGTVVAAPTSTSCLDTAQPRERTAYLLDGTGNRIGESLERWTGSAWASDARTTYEYTCHLDKATRGADNPIPSVTEYCYDLNDNLEKVWDPNHPRATNPNPTQLYAYDELNRLTSVTQPWAGAGGGNAVTTYGYDMQDHLSSVTDAESNLTTYTYSDRDLMTQQVSPVSGTSTYTYNEHGEQATETDARNIVTTRTPDALDRVTAVSYPDPTLNSTYTYDTGAFGKGRLAGIIRHGETLAYTYDRFGRLLQDGALAYTWDKNGNRATITYPEAITATYDHDFADRETTLTVQVGANPPLQLVNGATYEPFGPLKTLVLGNGLTETRAFDNRYAPSEIRVDGTIPVLDWSYTTDPVGNITGISDLLNADNNRIYAYQDVQYFLTQGNGPWGPRSWTYDRIGDRLTETRGAATDTYTYPTNTSGGRNPKLQSVAPPTGESRKYGYNAAGDNTLIYDQKTRLDLFYDASNRLSVLRSVAEDTRTHLLYDGRGFLRQASAGVEECRPGVTIPTYDSEGLLHRRAHLSLFTPAAPPLDTDTIFYFAGRPVATLRLYSTGSTLDYLTTDHLGTPVLATADTGTLVWQGGFEPFGANWNGASGAGVFLRFPGQWVDEEWEGGRLESGLYYNVWRWYGWGVGRYTGPDPLPSFEQTFVYIYANDNPLYVVDPLGLEPKCVEPSEHHYIGLGSLLHRLPGLHDPDYFNLLWYNTDCQDCKSPTDISVAPNPSLAFGPPGAGWLYSLMNPSIEFRERTGRGNNLRIGVSVQTRFTGWSGPPLFQNMGKLVLVCYDCK